MTEQIDLTCYEELNSVDLICYEELDSIELTEADFVNLELIMLAEYYKFTKYSFVKLTTK